MGVSSRSAAAASGLLLVGALACTPITLPSRDSIPRFPYPGRSGRLPGLYRVDTCVTQTVDAIPEVAILESMTDGLGGFQHVISVQEVVGTVPWAKEIGLERRRFGIHERITATDGLMFTDYALSAGVAWTGRPMESIANEMRTVRQAIYKQVTGALKYYL